MQATHQEIKISDYAASSLCQSTLLLAGGGGGQAEGNMGRGGGGCLGWRAGDSWAFVISGNSCSTVPKAAEILQQRQQPFNTVWVSRQGTEQQLYLVNRKREDHSSVGSLANHPPGCDGGDVAGLSHPHGNVGCIQQQPCIQKISILYIMIVCNIA